MDQLVSDAAPSPVGAAVPHSWGEPSAHGKRPCGQRSTPGLLRRRARDALLVGATTAQSPVFPRGEGCEGGGQSRSSGMPSTHVCRARRRKRTSATAANTTRTRATRGGPPSVLGWVLFFAVGSPWTTLFCRAKPGRSPLLFYLGGARRAARCAVPKRPFTRLAETGKRAARGMERFTPEWCGLEPVAPQQGSVQRAAVPCP